ncbi:MAG TPA: winged helix-turn-helix domain-containing protein [Rhodanobacteraceae bacterium]|nr:winged helix-turn-helix domain-containing protein [Rhodanobacteraceae bacterium]
MNRSYRFGEFRIIPALRELWRGDRLITLPPQVFECLTYLIEHHDRAVGRDELVAAVWGKTEISDTLLGQTILRIRRDLGDDAKVQGLLRTIPRFGYRWVAPLDIEDYTPPVAAASAPPVRAPEAVAPLDAAAAEPARESSDADAATTSGAIATGEPVRSRRRATTMLIGGLAAVLVIGAVVWALRLNQHAAPRISPAARGDSMVSAVLPAVVEPGDESAWMHLGIMDAVATRLRGSGLPSVPSEDVVALLKAPEANRSGTLREALAANLLVTPRVQRVGDAWEVSLDADDGAGHQYTAEAKARDAAAAARAAADQLLATLGRQPVETKEESAETVLVRRIDAAALADDLDGARALIAQASPEQQQSPEVRLRQAKIDYRAGKLDAAHDRLVAMLDEAPAKTAPVLRASILNGLGAVANAREQSSKAEQFFGEAALLLESHAEPEQLGQAYLGRAAAATDQGHFDAAAADFGRARIAYRQANDNLALIRVAADEGFADFDQRRPARALAELQAAAAGFKQWGALNEAIMTYIYEIACHLALLDGRAAMQAADAADELAQRVDNRVTRDRLMLARAKALVTVGRLREARAALDALRRSDAVAETIAGADGIVAQLNLDAGQFGVAGELAERAVAVLAAPTRPGARTDAWLTEVRAELRSGNVAKAATTLAAFENWAGQIDNARARLFAELARAEYGRQTAGTGDWHHAFVEAGKLAARDGIPYEIATVARSYADALLAEGELEGAAIEVGRVSRWADQDFGCAVLEARLFAATGRNEARQTAVARAQSLAGERPLPADALVVPVSTRAAKQ